MVELKQTASGGYGYKIMYNGKEVGVIECKDFWEGMPNQSVKK